MPETELDIWQDVEMTDGGLTVTTYSQRDTDQPVVEDESWWTWDELLLEMPGKTEDE
jgi:hypothetical protein